MASTLTKFAHLRIPLEEVVEATNNFHQDNFLSEGEFGPAYKGQLLHSGKLIKITARRFYCKPGRGDVEFWTEISVLSDLKHTNIVSIIGYCEEKDMRIIITPYVANGSLKKHLDSPNLTWTQRLRISVGVARALSHLHHGKERDYGFIHCNTNSYTILLDENWEAKLSSFEISIKLSVNHTDQFFLSEAFGMKGYTDPTFEMTGCLTFKSDIYSFGVVLFEILCGREAFILESESFLAPLAKDHYENKTLHDIIHPHIWNQILSPESHNKYSNAAYSCLNEVPSDRPNMDNILQELERALELQLRHEDIFNNLDHLKIPLSRILSATRDFSDTYKLVSSLDGWAFYRAELEHYDKENPSSNRLTTVLIKCYPPSGNPNYGEKQFLTEIEILSSGFKHPNIVSLLGFCFEATVMILVLEDTSEFFGAFLENWKDKRILTWEKRLKICIDVAHALQYIHYEMEDQKIIINRDINCWSIGLDENWGAKLVNFWWSVFLPPNQVDEALHLPYIGRRHYTDPAYRKTIKVKRESDVYGFGVVMFEILCGRFAYDPIYTKESDMGLGLVARRSFNTGTLEEMIDPIIKEEIGENNFVLTRGPNKDSLHTFIKIAHKCLTETQDQRPTMNVVVQELEKAYNFQVHSMDRNEEGCSELTEAVGDIQQLSTKYSKTGKQIQDHVSPTDTILSLVSKQSVSEHLKQEVTLKEQQVGKNLEHLKIPLNHIHSATDYFSEKYEIVFFAEGHAWYRAEVEHYDKENPSSNRLTTVLIKRYPPSGGSKCYEEKEFLTEIEILSSGVKHPNIVTLLGFCFEASEKILVLQDDFSNGLLGDYLGNLKDRSVLNWEKRLKICIDVAHALRYLHYEMEDQKIIINRDINSYNIGLDENWGPKIVHFWWSVFMPPNQKDDTLYLNWIGRDPYIDPNYKNSYKLKRESDVYGFGVLLFEILCGRIADDPIYKKESDLGLAPIARRSFNTGTLKEMIDPIIKEEIGENNFVLTRGPNEDSLHTFIEIAHKCLAETQDQRPTMKVVIKDLEKALLFHKNNKDNPKMLLEDIKRATRNFHKDNCIGGGGFGRVYKGNLQDGDQFRTIVAKRLDTRFGQGEQQFLSELQILLNYKHENVIGLIGYCNENDEKIIIYDYASRGSLDRYLSDTSLTWVKRLNICIDVARALDFLHGGARKQGKVIHRDIKTANILINDDWKAKLADFGLSLISPLIQKTDYVIDHACGTPGYLDPLYRKTGFLTIESDIYSFGVVLFEMLCGRSTFIIHQHEGHYLPDFIKNKFEERKHDEVVFEQIREQIEPKSLTTFQKIASRCLHHEREDRPTTKEVLMQLKKALAFQNMDSTMTKFAPLRIPLEDIVKATDNFHDDNIIQHGGFGTTYKGRLLRSGKELKIAARRFDCKHGEGDLEFMKEISVLYDLKHSNLVSIIGFCDEKDDKIIVTTHEANGSLGQYLSNPYLTWKQRLRICVGVARALSFLYYDKGRNYGIIHCNINSDTILLDDNWEAKLSGFEFSIKQSVDYKDQVCFCEHTGTMGCIDPAIEKMGGVTHKSDIYSFGVVLFEILCGRKAFIKNEVNMFLAPLAKYHYENGTLQDIVHPDLWSQISTQSLFKYSRASYSCLKEKQSHRPDTHAIVATLGKALQSQLNDEKNLEQLKIRLSDIQLATNNFSEASRIASVDDCTLYRAKFNHFDKENLSSGKGKYEGEYPKGHNTVVIKRYPSGRDLHGEDRFFTEIEMLSSVKHPNIVTLIGFCVEDSEMILVTENVSNGYLIDYLRNANDMHILTWEKRLKICIDVAHVLYYLHYEMEDQKVIINRDIYSRNIGLDENWGAKIVYFGDSVFLPPSREDEALYLNKIGRSCYIDPEYEKTGRLKRESDVYSFGVVMFEILCGRKAFDPIYEEESDKGLVIVARRSFYAGTLEDLIDPILKEVISENSFVQNGGPNRDSLHTFIEIANHCVAETQDRRPTMKLVVKELEKALFFQVNGSVSKQEQDGEQGICGREEKKGRLE